MPFSLPADDLLAALERRTAWSRGGHRIRCAAHYSTLVDCVRCAVYFYTSLHPRVAHPGFAGKESRRASTWSHGKARIQCACQRGASNELPTRESRHSWLSVRRERLSSPICIPLAVGMERSRTSAWSHGEAQMRCASLQREASVAFPTRALSSPPSDPVGGRHGWITPCDATAPDCVHASARMVARSTPYLLRMRPEGHVREGCRGSVQV